MFRFLDNDGDKKGRATTGGGNGKQNVLILAAGFRTGWDCETLSVVRQNCDGSEDEHVGSVPRLPTSVDYVPMVHFTFSGDSQ